LNIRGAGHYEEELDFLPKGQVINEDYIISRRNTLTEMSSYRDDKNVGEITK